MMRIEGGPHAEASITKLFVHKDKIKIRYFLSLDDELLPGDGWDVLTHKKKFGW